MLRVIHCKNEEELDNLCKVLDIFEYHWMNGCSLADKVMYAGNSIEDTLYVVDTETKSVHCVEKEIIEFEEGTQDWAWCRRPLKVKEAQVLVRLDEGGIHWEKRIE